MSFDQFALHARVIKGVQAVGYTEPTPIQEQAIPAVMAGRDVLGLAQTGTGKTAAFALPILHRLMDGPRNKTRALVVAPTRELAEQINDSFKDLGQATGIRSATVYGGVGMNPQIQALRRGTEVIVACPGRLLDLMQQGFGDFRNLEVLVLDEADHMFDMGFLPDIRKLLAQLPTARQSLLFSATMPHDVRYLVDETLRDPVTVRVTTGTAPVETVDHVLYPVEAHLKTDLLDALLRDWDARRVLVFTRTKHRAKRLAEQLDRRGFFTANIQGNLSQRKRQDALEGFRRGDVHVLVATDIAARGIDVSMVSHVVNYDVPDTEEAYTHRIGRTGRARMEGDAVTFVTSADRDMIRRIERSVGETIPEVRHDAFDYSVSAPRHLDAEAKRFERGGSPNTGRGGARGGSRGGGGGGGGRRDRPSVGSGTGGRARPQAGSGGSRPSPAHVDGGEGAGGGPKRRRRRRGGSGGASD
ncbi:MAG: DEAD/DEAH box helicase [Trueperaceae bacterium]|nr:DEAD/DEAH box helicase [Trueperaceae bacterium]